MKYVMKRFSILVLAAVILLLIGSLSIAQNAGTGGGNQKKIVGQELVTFILDDFEKANSWIPKMPRDQGVIFSMRRKGSPEAVKKAAALIKTNNQQYLQARAKQGQVPKENPLIGFPYNKNEYVLGVRVEFLKRGYNYFTVQPARPIKIPGITESISVYVVGRGYNHRLWLMIRDYNGNKRFIDSDRPLNHRGWRQITFPIKPNITQQDHKVTDPKRIGIAFEGFLVHCDPIESSGKYYIYFDLLTAKVNLYFEFQRDQDDMRDFW